MEDLIKLWIKPEYLPMLAVITLSVKYAIVPGIKAFLPETHYKGYTPIIIAYIGAVVAAFLWKILFPVAAWTARDVLMVIIVGLFAAMSAIGANTSVQALKGKDVSIGT